MMSVRGLEEKPWPWPWTLDVQRPGQWVESVSDEYDPDWRHVDKAGHGHFYKRSKKNSFPTLDWVRLPCTMGHGDDCDAEGFFQCAQCGERIRPGTRAAKPVFIGGPVEYRLTVTTNSGKATYSFGEREWFDLCDALNVVVDERLGPFRTSFEFMR